VATVAAVTMLSVVVLAWTRAPRLAINQRALRLTALGAVATIVCCLVDEKLGWSGRFWPWDDGAYFERIPLFAGIVVLLAVAWGSLRGLRRVAVATLGVVATLYCVLEVAGPVFLPLVAGQLDASAHGHGAYASEVQQSTGWSCAPAALAWALRLQGLPASEREMAQLSATTPLHGTFVRGMLRAAHLRGLPARAVYPASWETVVAAPKPALADWRYNAVTSHMIVVIAIAGDQVTVGDPLGGEVTYSRAEFLARWQRTLVVFR
jgi:hypothetical protein